MILFKDDLELILAEHGQSAIYESNSFACHVGAIKFRKNPELEAIYDDNDIEILSTQSNISPVVGKNITVNSIAYRIEEVIKDNHSISVLIRCKKV
jgi:hypothetical protein